MNPNIKEILNYAVFIALFIGSFYFIYKTYTEIIGLVVLFLINTAFLLFTYIRISPRIQFINKGAYVANLALFSIIIGLFFTFISLLFTIAMIYTTQQKYTAEYGTNIELPEPYHTEVDIYKRLLISCYCLVAVLLFFTMPSISNSGDAFDKLIVNASIFKIYDEHINITIQKPIAYDVTNVIKFLSNNGYKVFTTATSLTLLGLSSYIIYISNDFLKINQMRIIE